MKSRPRSLAWRLYAFAMLIVFLTVGTMISLPALLGSRINERDARLIEELASQLDKRAPDDGALVRVLAEPSTLSPASVLHVFDRRGTYLAGRGAPVDPPDHDELAVSAGAPRAGLRRVVVAMGADRVVVHTPEKPPLPIAALLVLLAIIVTLTLIATLWFARTIARPLRALGRVARELGRGDMAARAHLVRYDELGEVGRAFDEMAERIEQLLRSQRAMMADISHELRTPLTRIKLALDLATADPAAAQQVLDDVGADLEEIEQIVEDVFDMVKLDSSSALVRNTEIDLNDLVQRSVARFEVQHPEHRVVLETGDHVLRTKGDPALLRRALDNLLDNAGKYSAPGEPVTLRLDETEQGARIEVIDRGIGMSTAELALAFTPFWRADSSRTRATGGVGLGLALSRRIARAHGGEVELSPGRVGTIARLILPR